MLRPRAALLVAALFPLSACASPSRGAANVHTTGAGGSAAVTGGTGGSGAGSADPTACDNPGLQANAPWPSIARCTHHRASSPHVGPQTNHVKWRVPVAPVAQQETHPGMGVTIDADGTVYVAGSSLFAFSADGTLKWAADVVANDAPTIGADGTLFVSSEVDRSIVAVEPAHGGILWSTSGVAPVSPLVPAIGADGTILAVDGSLRALSPAGADLWSLGGAVSLESYPAVAANGTIYVALGGSDGLVAVSAAGASLWTPGFPDHDSLPNVSIAADGTIYFSGVGVIDAVTPSEELLWSAAPAGMDAVFAWIAVAPDGTLVTLGFDGSGLGGLFALSPEDGSVRWRSTFVGSSDVAPAIGADGTIYVSFDGELYALRSSDGSQVFTYPGGCGSAAIGADGTLYAMCSGHLTAFGP